MKIVRSATLVCIFLVSLRLSVDGTLYLFAAGISLCAPAHPDFSPFGSCLPFSSMLFDALCFVFSLCSLSTKMYRFCFVHCVMYTVHWPRWILFRSFVYSLCLLSSDFPPTLSACCRRRRCRLPPSFLIRHRLFIFAFALWVLHSPSS